MIENSKRSAIKAISWRITGTIDTMIISYFITGKIKWAISIGGVEIFTKIFLYFLHERVWDKIKYGRRIPKGEEYNI
ncbi:MAG: DUF2061 domain-containing protein [Elusimicrobia bacterium]|nr:DUF2061 domain-containing protein [Elusimicrobiota bacterium]